MLSMLQTSHQQRAPMHTRRFLFLQGPHGPFFRQLAGRFRALGHVTHKIGFNAGDAFFWSPRSDYCAYKNPLTQWAKDLPHILNSKKITDLVLYGENRPVHQQALEIASAMGITTHIFEEGYLRPYWVTYERDGSNGNSPLTNIPLSAMQSVTSPTDAPEHAAGWGELYQHMFYGAAHHAALIAGKWRYPDYCGHREISHTREAALNVGNFLATPWHAVERRSATARLKMGGYPYHLVLLQLEHDSSFRGHAKFSSMGEFAQVVIEEFACGAKSHHHLVFKAHPLEDGRCNIRECVRRAAELKGIGQRVHYLRGGKLAGLLDHAASKPRRKATRGGPTAAKQAPQRTGQCYGDGTGEAREKGEAVKAPS